MKGFSARNLRYMKKVAKEITDLNFLQTVSANLKYLKVSTMEKNIKEFEKSFEKANESFIRKNAMLFETRVSERTLCGTLMMELYEVIRDTISKKHRGINFAMNEG